MKEINNLVVKTFSNGKYIIEISETENMYKSHIFGKSFGTKLFMFGAEKSKMSLSEYVHLALEDWGDEAARYKREVEERDDDV